MKFKKGDIVVFYQDLLTNKRFYTVPEMFALLESRTLLIVTDSHGNNKVDAGVLCDPRDYQHSFNFDEGDLRHACTLIRILSGGKYENKDG